MKIQVIVWNHDVIQSDVTGISVCYGDATHELQRSDGTFVIKNQGQSLFLYKQTIVWRVGAGSGLTR